LRRPPDENDAAEEDDSIAMLPSRKGLVDITAKFQQSAKGIYAKSRPG
jgi:hypothetical protein